MAHSASYSFPIGSLTVGYENDTVISLKISENSDVSGVSSLFSDQVALELQEYFDGKRTRFTFPLCLDGTDFQKAVWQALLGIPYGQTRTYSQIAAAIGRPKASRAVGIACSKNPVWIAVPCHRVIGKNNTLTGYAGGLDLKQKLLNLEKVNS